MPKVSHKVLHFKTEEELRQQVAYRLKDCKQYRASLTIDYIESKAGEPWQLAITLFDPT